MVSLSLIYQGACMMHIDDESQLLFWRREMEAWDSLHCYLCIAPVNSNYDQISSMYFSVIHLMPGGHFHLDISQAPWAQHPWNYALHLLPRFPTVAVLTLHLSELTLSSKQPSAAAILDLPRDSDVTCYMTMTKLSICPFGFLVEKVEGNLMTP